MAGTTTRYVFDLQPGDVYWCTADCGWCVASSKRPACQQAICERLDSATCCLRAAQTCHEHACPAFCRCDRRACSSDGRLTCELQTRLLQAMQAHTCCVSRITGHTYLTYGPLLNGASCVVFEGVPSYPDCGRCWQVVEKYKVSLEQDPKGMRGVAYSVQQQQQQQQQQQACIGLSSGGRRASSAMCQPPFRAAQHPVWLR